MKKPLISELTLEEKVGQMLLGYQWDIHRKTRTLGAVPESLRTKEERDEYLLKEKFGTLWAQTGMGSRGLDQDMADKETTDTSAEYGEWIMAESDVYKIPALTSLDCESGAADTFKDLSRGVGAMTLGAANDEQLCYDLGVAIAKELRCAGATWRWAPVVDVGSKRTNQMLRTYRASEPERQIELANAHIAGTQSQGVAATAKHFPGGDKFEFRDSHFCPTQLNTNYDEWWEEQGRIFQGVIDGGVYSIMTSHHAFPAVDDSKINGLYRPATISKKITTDLLKEKMGFKGVVITDSIAMGALFTLLPYEELIVEIVNAGNDVILGCMADTNEIICKAVRDGRISEERINDGCQRVLDMKEKLGMFEEGYRHVKGKAEELVPETRKINLEVARRGLTLVRDRNNNLPFNKEKIKNVTIIASSHSDSIVELLEPLKKEFEDRGASVKIQRRLVNNEDMDRVAAESDLIVYAVYIRQHQPMGLPSLYGKEMETYFYGFTNGKEKSVGISFGYPYVHFTMLENADMFINAYSPSPEMMKACVEAIYGEIEFKGDSPVELNPDIRNF
ncbi:MAG: hypothetical protein J6A69_12695 [Clostridia bacterium]|nr:hypothetical protein [Clostridia bacterium]